MVQLFLILLSIEAALGKLEWVELKSASGSVPVARRDSSIAYDPTTNKVVIFGGRSSSTLGDTWIFDLLSKTWRKVNETVGSDGITIPANRFSMVYGANNGAFYISTGEYQGGGGTSFYNDILKFDFNNEKWTRLEPKSSVKPEVRYGSGGGIHPDGDGFYITHGFAEKRYSNTLKFSLKTEKWEERFSGTNSYNPSYPHSRCLHGSVMTGPDEVVIYGGCLGGGSTGGPCPSEDGWKFDSSKSWTLLKQCATPRIYSAMAMLPSNSKNAKRAVLYGGRETTGSVLMTAKAPSDEVILFDPNANKWSRKKIEGVVPTQRNGHVMATTKDGVLVFGGAGANGVMNDLWLLRGNVSDAMETADLGECDSMNFNLIMLHGIFMFIGWGVLLQGGAFVARYFRHKDPWWFKMHRGLQVSGLLFAIGGFVCAVISVPFDHFAFAHGGLGLAIMILGILQPLNAVIRPHKFPDGSRSRKRIVWEWFHKLLGRLALVLALINICLGLFLAVTPVVAWAVWYALLGVFVIAYAVMEIRLRKNKTTTDSADITMKET